MVENAEFGDWLNASLKGKLGEWGGRFCKWGFQSHQLRIQENGGEIKSLRGLWNVLIQLFYFS
jgi:hypothetical protein